MACPCRNRNKNKVNSPTAKLNNAPNTTLEAEKLTKLSTPPPIVKKEKDAKEEALETNLEQCYLCAKKHIARAQIFFEEYHTGYPDHVKNLIESLRVSENEVRSAFLDWQKIMGQLDMAAGELLGNDPNSDTMQENHLIVARAIRAERLRLSDDPMYIPDFNELLVAIHTLQYKTLG